MNRQQELLLILAEEASEVAQACSKIQRFGIENNRGQLVQELGDFLALLDLVHQEFGITEAELQEAYDIKMERLKIYSNLITKEQDNK
jgi:NTP pyrophosphatase (non-canonical NTP hydrolase)